MKNKEASLVLDPVCGQVVDADFVAHASEYKGKRYSFCCEQCQASFDAEPQRYLEARDRGPYH